jgi:DNA modification methylase
VTGRLLHGDNLQLLRAMPDRSVNCVYADPPFNTGKTWSGAAGSFPDVFEWDAAAVSGLGRLRDRGGSVPNALALVEAVHGRGPWLAYGVFMALRLVELARVLTGHGYCWVHVNPEASPFVRVVGDAAFGSENSLGQVAWVRSAGMNNSSRRFAANHDDISVWGGWKTTRRRFTFPSVLDDCPAPASSARERVGYPTQKPVELLSRIVRWSTLPGHVVLDPFCGSGTTLVAAQRLGREWVGMDASGDAISAARGRLGTNPDSSGTGV